MKELDFIAMQRGFSLKILLNFYKFFVEPLPATESELWGISELLKRKQCFSSRNLISLKKLSLVCFWEIWELFQKSYLPTNIFQLDMFHIFQLDMFHDAEAVRTSLKKISIVGVFLSYGTPESFFNSCFSNCY